MKKLLVLSLIFPCLLFTFNCCAQSVSPSVIANVTCHGLSNGSVTCTPSGGLTPYTYLWSPGSQTTQTATGLTAATYTITLHDHLAHTASASVTVSQPAALSVTASAKLSSVCPGQSDSLFASASGGSAPFTYLWTAPYDDISCPTCPNTNSYPYGAAYMVTAVYDGNGCTATSSVNVTVNPFPYVTISGPINPIAPGRADTLIAHATGATSYAWSNSATTSAIRVTPSVSTTYSVTVHNTYGCLDTAHYTIDTNKVGNGTSSSNAIRIVPSTTLNMASFSTKDSVVWFSFTAADSNNQIIANSAYLGMPVPHVHRLTLYNGSMQMIMDEPMPDIVGANQIRMDISHLHIGSTYYVRAARCPANANMAGCNPSASGECNPTQRWDFQMGFRTVSVFVPKDSGSEPPSTSQLYYEHRGQIADFNDIPRFDIKAYTNFGYPGVFASDSAVSFVYRHTDTVGTFVDSFQRVDMILTGASVQPSQPVFKMEEDSNGGYLNYFKEFIENGVTKIEGYSRLVYKNVYPNVDMHVYSNTVGTKLYFVCNPGGTGGGGNPANIELQFNGATSVRANGSGGLDVITELGTLTFAPGYAYTDSSGIIKPKSWQAYFVSVNSNTVRFNTGSFNSNEPLVIQVDRGHLSPQNIGCIDNLCWGTFYEGTDGGTQVVTGVTHDNTGNIYAVGYTSSQKFPVQNGIQPQLNADTDAIVGEFYGKNDSLLWSTYYGGSGDDIGNAIAVDSAFGNIYITGSTNSADLPMPNVYSQGYLQAGGLNGTNSGTNTDIFIAKLSYFSNNSKGPFLAWATWYGGPGNEVGYGIAVDNTSPHNNLYIVGQGDINTPLYDEPGAYYDSTSGTGLILKFNTDGLRQWATLMDSAATTFYGCTADAGNNLLITGESGPHYPVSGGFSYKGGNDAVVTKFNTANDIVWSGYYGGSGEEIGYAIAADAGGNAYITGYTTSSDTTAKIELAKPHTWSFYQDLDGNGYNSGDVDPFIAEFATSNGALLWGTYFGAEGSGQGLAVDANGNLYLTGDISGFDLPLNPPVGAYANGINMGGTVPFLAAFNVGKGYYWGTYFGDAPAFGNALGITAYGASKLYIGGEAHWEYAPFVNPGGGAWFQDSTYNYNVSTASMTEFNISGITTGENEEITKNEELRVYPNPTNENITIQLNIEQTGNVEYTLYDLLGEPVYSETENEPSGSIQKQISLASLPNGNYILSVIVNGSAYHAKITKLQ